MNPDDTTAPSGRRHRWRFVALAVLVVWLAVTVTGAYLATPTSETLAPSGVSEVVLFGVPGLTLGDLTEDVMPNLSALTGAGAVAAANVRTGSDRPDVTEAYATVGAGYRMRSGSAGAWARDRSGAERPPDVEVLDMPSRSRGRDRVDDGQPGALADALVHAGRNTGVVTNADTDAATDALGPGVAFAPAAVAAAEPSGAIGFGSVGAGLTRPDPDVPAGVDTDRSSFVDAFDKARQNADFVVVDPGITTRLGETGVTSRTEWVDALGRTDAILGDIVERLTADTVLIVVGVVPPGSTWQLTPVVVAGAGVEPGALVSPSTHRRDLVTVTDLAPTVLGLLDTEPPASMTGHRLQTRPGKVDLDRMRSLDDMLVSRRGSDQPLTLVFILSQSALYAIGVVALARGRLGGRGGSVLMLGVLTCAAWPLTTFWIRLSPALSSLGTATALVTWGAAVLVALGASRFRSHPLDPLLAICGALVATVLVDLSTGAHLQYGSFFGYAPNKGTRFTGIGNASFALLGAATIMTCTALVARARNRADGWWASVFVATAVVFANGAPWMGSDVGGILALVPVLGLFLWVLAGRRVTARSIVAAVLVAVAMLATAVGLDALRPADQRTHVARFFLGATEWSLVRSTVGVKVSANLRILRQSLWAWLVPITVLLSLVALVVGRLWGRTLRPGSPERQGLIATLVFALVGWLVNDSGIVVVALASIFIGPFVLLLARDHETDDPRRPPGAAGVTDAPVEVS